MKTKNAFTLVDLIVVVAMVGILIAILIPYFASSKEKITQDAIDIVNEEPTIIYKDYQTKEIIDYDKDLYDIVSMEVSNKVYIIFVKQKELN